MKNLAKALSSSPIIEKSKLEEYSKLVRDIKSMDNKKEILNKEIKLILGKFVLENLESALEDYPELIENYQLARDAGDEEELEETLEVLDGVGITQEMVEDYLLEDPVKALSHNKIDLDIEGFKVKTSIQDRSKLDELRAIAYLRLRGRDDLLTTKTIVNEAALEIAIGNNEIDAKSFKKASIQEVLVVALTIK